MSPVAPCANIAWGIANLPAYAAFAAALDDPRQAQDRILQHYVKQNADTQFGREHHFHRIQSADDFRRRVPLRNYDDFAPYIDRIAAGEPNVLTAAGVTRLATSSGSTRAAKWIPYTSTFQAELNRAIAPWIVDLFLNDPELTAGCAYWSISPVVRRADAGTTVVPIGFEEDTVYLGGVRKHLVDAVMAVPGEVRHCDNMDTFRYVTQRFLLGRRDLRLISVWHPSFWDLLLNGLAERWDELLNDIGHGTLSASLPLSDRLRHRLSARLRPDRRRANELRSIGPKCRAALWPDLRLISAWGSAHADGPSAALRRSFPDVRFQNKGLLATEAFVSIPFRDRWPLAIRSHFFEFLDDAGRPRLADGLRLGAEYAVVVTTGGGLYRYRLGDRVRVTDRLGRTPSIEFIGRDDAVVDLCGEKLSEGFVAAVLRELFADSEPPPTFAMLAPSMASGPGYTLFVECYRFLSAALLHRLDAALRRNPQYAYCRDLGQLGPPRLFAIRGNAYPTYAATLSQMGTRLGDLKPTALSPHAGWEGKFDGERVDDHG